MRESLRVQADTVPGDKQGDNVSVITVMLQKAVPPLPARQPSGRPLLASRGISKVDLTKVRGPAPALRTD